MTSVLNLAAQIILLFAISISACTRKTTKLEHEDDLRPESKEKLTNPAKDEKKILALQQEPEESKTAKPESAACIPFQDQTPTPPFWLEKKGIVITRILKECTTQNGQKGYEEESPWVAMGFPCTGGNGRIEVGGHYFAPKIVSLKLSTDCQMLPPSREDVQSAGTNALTMKQTAKLLAFNPFAVQYWEIPGFSDADVGFSIDLRSVEAKQQLWREFVEKKPISIKLYGRENAWMRGYDFFFVDGELISTGALTFQLNIKEVKPLSKEEINQIRQRCEALQPRRSCHTIFS